MADGVMSNQSSRRYLAFDIETAKDVPGDFADWRAHRPIGITCAATCSTGAEPKLWFSHVDGVPARQMSRTDAQQLLAYLIFMASQGYTIVTWNGASFDFDVLAEETGSLDSCRACVDDHIDMMFHLVCALGFGVRLARVAEGMGLPGKADGMNGEQAPSLWAQGEYDQVLGYVAQDARLTLQIAHECDLRQAIDWISHKGEKKTEALPYGWRTVRQALELPLPDTSQLERPLRRDEVLAWMGLQLRS